MIQARWDNRSEEWVRNLGRFADLLLPQVRRAVFGTMRWAVHESKPWVPVFEGDLQDDLQFLYGPRPMGNYRVRIKGIIGFSDATVQPEMESSQGPKPFAIARGKHYPGAAEEHGVYLYHPGTGGSTAGRAKLVRYLKEHVGGAYNNLPAEPDKQDVQDWQREEELMTGTKPKPFVNVDPGASANDFLWQLIADDGDPLVSELVDRVYQAFGRVW